MSLSRQLHYQWLYRILRRKELLAERLPLGMSLGFYPPDDVGRKLFKYGIHEAHLFDWLQQQPAPEPGDLALDVGANLGWYSVLLERLSCGRLDIHAFEPEPVNRGLLEANLQRNDCQQVTVSTLALGDACGAAELHRYRDINRGKHSLEALDRSTGTTTVELCTLDAYLAAASLEERPIWFLKLDVEGHEAAVLRGARNTLTRVRSLALEYSPTLSPAGAAAPMLEALYAAGFEAQRWTRGRWVSSTARALLAQETQCDTVWVRP